MKSRKAKLPTAISMDFKRTHAVNERSSSRKCMKKGRYSETKSTGLKESAAERSTEKKFER